MSGANGFGHIPAAVPPRSRRWDRRTVPAPPHTTPPRTRSALDESRAAPSPGLEAVATEAEVLRGRLSPRTDVVLGPTGRPMPTSPSRDR